MGYDTVAAVDLGSNSFRLQVGRVVGDQIYPLDGLKESVRLAAGLQSNKLLDGPSQIRAIDALSRFGERVRGFDAGAVRAVATNTLRVAKNSREFLVQAEAALGFPIEVISGREEARLIYVGVAHTLPNPTRQQLVVDIGGGSTEVIIGRNMQPIELESLYMGCVGFSVRFFPRGRFEKKGLKEAEFAARRELQAISRHYLDVGWDEAVGSSGTAKAIADLIELNGLGSDGITRDGIGRLKERLLRAGDPLAANLIGMRADRVPVLPGGLAIMSAVFDTFSLERMAFSDGALRLGVLYDLLGRHHHQDPRDTSVSQFMRRYGVELVQAKRVCETALALYGQLASDARPGENPDAQFLEWAARLHEVGISIAHASYHKHSAYILANADMPGFSRMDQWRLARLVLGHRGKLERVLEAGPEEEDWPLILCLRLAVLLHRSRDDSSLPRLRLKVLPRGFQLTADAAWLESVPLTAAALEEEERQWASVAKEFRLKTPRKSESATVE